LPPRAGTLPPPEARRACAGCLRRAARARAATTKAPAVRAAPIPGTAQSSSTPAVAAALPLDATAQDSARVAMDVFLRCAENQLLKIRSMAARWVLAISQGVMGRAIPADITPPAETKVTRADGRCCAPAARAAASEPYSHRAAATGTKGSVGLRPARRHSGAARAAVAALGLRAYARIILPALSAPLRRSGRRDEAAHAYELVSPYFTGTFYRADALNPELALEREG
jgi:hypothetical protein